MIEIFKTNVQSAEHAIKLVLKIEQKYPEIQINFDLEDCDKIMRVQGLKILKNKIIKIVVSEGYFCQVLL